MNTEEFVHTTFDEINLITMVEVEVFYCRCIIGKINLEDKDVDKEEE